MARGLFDLPLAPQIISRIEQEEKMLKISRIQKMEERADAFTLKIDGLTAEEAAVIELLCNKYALKFQEYPITHITKKNRYKSLEFLVFFDEQNIKENVMKSLELDIIVHFPEFIDQFLALHRPLSKKFSVTNDIVNLESLDTSSLAQSLSKPYPTYRALNYDNDGQLVDYIIGIENAYIEEVDCDRLEQICVKYDLRYSQNGWFFETRFKSEQLALGVFQKWRQDIIGEIPCLIMTLTEEKLNPISEHKHNATPQTSYNIVDELVTNKSQRQARSLFDNSKALVEQYCFFRKLENRFLETQRHNDDDIQHAYDRRFGLMKI